AAVRIPQLKGAAIAVRVWDRVAAAGQRPPAVLRLVPDQAHDAGGLSVEASPEADDLVLPGVGHRQSERRFDRFRAAAVELGAAEVPGREARDHLEQAEAALGGEAADR